MKKLMYSDGTQTMRMIRSSRILVPPLSIPLPPLWIPVASPGRAGHGAEAVEICPGWVCHLTVVEAWLWSSWAPRRACPSRRLGPAGPAASKPSSLQPRCGTGRSVAGAGGEARQIPTHASPAQQAAHGKGGNRIAIWLEQYEAFVVSLCC